MERMLSVQTLRDRRRSWWNVEGHFMCWDITEADSWAINRDWI
jgi:hypothetical protein